MHYRLLVRVLELPLLLVELERVLGVAERFALPLLELPLFTVAVRRVLLLEEYKGSACWVLVRVLPLFTVLLDDFRLLLLGLLEL